MNETKIGKAKALYDDGDKIGALKIVAKFKRLGEHDKDIKLAYDVYQNESFYIQLKKDTKAILKDGIIAMSERYGW